MKNISFITGSRSEYDLIKPLIIELKKHKNVKGNLIICGNHFEKQFGETFKIIKKDRIIKLYKINIKLKKDDNLSVSIFVSKTIKILSLFLKNIKPDLVIILGDRYEILAASIASFLLKIPIVHIHGGEITEGAYDDSIRHAITKLSSIHFTAHNQYKKRIIQMGEDKKNVYNFGSIGAENLYKKEFIKKSNIARKLNIKFRDKNIVFCYHSVTNEKDYGLNLLKKVLNVLSKYKHATIIFLGTNADPKNKSILKLINKFKKKNKSNSYFFKSLGQNLFHSLLKNTNLLIGNSSSGILEAPSLGIPVINLGNRQRGRVMAKNILNPKKSVHSIKKTIDLTLSSSFTKKLKYIKNPFYKSNTVKNIIKIILKKKLINFKPKKFYDL